LLAGLLEMLLPENNLRRFVKVVMGLFIIVTLLVPMVTFLAQDESWAVSAWQYTGDQDGDVASVFSNGKNISSDMQEATIQECEKRLGRQVEAVVALVPGIKTVRARVQTKAGPIGDTWSGIELVTLEISLINAKSETKKLPESTTLSNREDADSPNEEEVSNEGVSIVRPVAPVEITDPQKSSNLIKKDEGGAKGPVVSNKPDDSSASVNEKEIELQVKSTVANFYGVPREKIQVVFD